jgi:hypothetical protein
LPSGHIAACSLAFSSASSSTPPAAARANMAPAYTASRITTLFSDEQLVALSKVLERAIAAAASARLAEASMMLATLPAPTPKAGVPLA